MAVAKQNNRTGYHRLVSRIESGPDAQDNPSVDYRTSYFTVRLMNWEDNFQMIVVPTSSYVIAVKVLFVVSSTFFRNVPAYCVAFVF